jgi:hypothetical protein
MVLTALLGLKPATTIRSRFDIGAYEYAAWCAYLPIVWKKN